MKNLFYLNQIFILLLIVRQNLNVICFELFSEDPDIDKNSVIVLMN